ncbi:GNAT family N-acetyltransferase [Gordonia sp. X0973]|uniref:GNAT family N-acetyltransferase n=1 Tax=Gordonia sp. X0973 TaxID=2742602 RepID=UPI000F53CEEB|nr:GNAT family N-acetyltransferase [Gordonia sp. X0973]QKT07375.1 GNAT family N-acetyltransferase [Gordonia sp. X0973]
MIIDTARLWLRPVLLDDAPAMVALDADPRVMRFVNGGSPTPRAQIVDWTIPRARAEYTAHGTGIRTLILKDTAEFAGWIELRRPRHSSRTELELSYRLPHHLWGRGLATEAAIAILRAAFTEHRAQRVFAGTSPQNAASRKVLQKIGMRRVPTLLDDDYEVEYEVLRHHWEMHTATTSRIDLVTAAGVDTAATTRRGAVVGRHRLPDALAGA